MLAADPSRPAALEDIAQGFGLADAVEGFARGVLDDSVDRLDGSASGGGPTSYLV